MSLVEAEKPSDQLPRKLYTKPTSRLLGMSAPEVLMSQWQSPTSTLALIVTFWRPLVGLMTNSVTALDALASTKSFLVTSEVTVPSVFHVSLKSRPIQLNDVMSSPDVPDFEFFPLHSSVYRHINMADKAPTLVNNNMQGWHKDARLRGMRVRST